MPIYQSEIPSLNNAASSLADLIVGGRQRSQQAYLDKQAELQQAKDLLPIQQQQAQQAADIEVAKKGQEQAQSLQALKQLKDSGMINDGGGATVNGVGVTRGNNILPMMLRQEAMTQKQAEGYSKRLEKLGGFQSALQDLDEKTNRDGQGGILTNPNAKLISTGGAKSAIPTSMLGLASLVNPDIAKQVDERKSLERLQLEYQKAMSGMRVTDQARKQEKQAMGWVASGDPDLVAKGVRALAHNVENATKIAQGGYSQEARAQVHASSGDPLDLYKNIINDNAASQGPAAPASAAPSQGQPLSFEEFKKLKAAGKL